MLLCIDLGNTSLKLAIFDQDKIVAFNCFDSKQNDYRALFLSFLYKAGLREDGIEDVIISSVVPSLFDPICDAAESITNKPVIEISYLNDYGIRNEAAQPEEVGNDILVMSSYAYSLFKKELLIVSIGTCSVISHVSEDGAFKHCIIAPGLHKMAETLWNNAALLPETNVEHAHTFLANNTIDAMNVGIYNGYVGMLEYLISSLKKELGTDPYVVACGGVGKLVYPYTSIIDYYEPDLVTKGLNYIYNTYYKKA